MKKTYSYLSISIIIIVVILTGIIVLHYNALRSKKGSNSAYPASNVTDAFKELLLKAKNNYIKAITNNKSWSISIDSKFAKELVTNATVLGKNRLQVDDNTYSYAILSLFYNGLKVYNASNASVDGVSIALLPRNKSITYTGCQPSTYRVAIGHNNYTFTFFFCGPAISSYSLYTITENVTNGVYFIEIDAGPWSNLSTVDFLLVKEPGNPS